MEWVMYRYHTPHYEQPFKRPNTALQPADQPSEWDFSTHDALGRVISRGALTTSSTTSGHSAPGHPAAAAAAMDTTRASVSSGSTPSLRDDHPALSSSSSSFYLRHGRRYLRDLPYPLPCDLPELQRQNLQTLIAATIFGKPLCASISADNPPKKVLEVACGSAYWSSLCHDYLASLGYTGVQFTGLDIIPVAPDLRKEGIDWRFVQHDLRKIPLPFDDEEFDIIMMKDMSLVAPRGQPAQRVLEECIRVLKRGGNLEIWETDHTVRSLLPHPPPSIGKRQDDQERAISTGTFLVFPGTPFTEPHNKYIQDYNNWLTEAFDRRKLHVVPSARVAQVLIQEPDTLGDFGYRRVAIPLGELRWERDGSERDASKRRQSQSKKGKEGALTEEQAALRYTALLVLIQKIESLEPILKEVSGKNQEEWQRWWSWMMSDLLENRAASAGECLEMGAWWSKKL